MNMDWIYYSYAEPPNSAVLRTLSFGSLDRRISDFANASSKFLASLGTSDIPKTLATFRLVTVIEKDYLKREFYYKKNLRWNYEELSTFCGY